MLKKSIKLQQNDVKQWDLCKEVLKQVLAAGFVAVNPVESLATHLSEVHKQAEGVTSTAQLTALSRMMKFKGLLPKQCQEKHLLLISSPRGPKSMQVFLSDKHCTLDQRGVN